MRRVANAKNLQLRANQFDELLKILATAADQKEDLEVFLSSFLSISEKAILSQRLQIIVMILRGFTYQKIMEDTKVSTSAIHHAQKCIELGGDRLINLVANYQIQGHSARATTKSTSNNHELKRKTFKIRQPGSII